MKVENTARGFVITRGKKRVQVFVMFVDHDSASWTKLEKLECLALVFKRRGDAEAALSELRRRATLKPKAQGRMSNPALIRILIFAVVSTVSSFAQLPNPDLTPGATVKATQEQVCTRGYSKRARHVTAATKRHVYQLYGVIPGTKGYIVDHKIPIELGGANTLNNLQLQTRADAHHKDLAENAARQLVCEAGVVLLQQAQNDFASNNFEKYISVTPEGEE